MSMERVSRGTPLTWKEEARYKLHRMMYNVAGSVASRIQHDAIWQLVGRLGTAWAWIAGSINAAHRASKQSHHVDNVCVEHSRARSYWILCVHELSALADAV